MTRLTTLEICAGGGGQALGLEQAGFDHLALVEFDAHCCATLRLNRPTWNIVRADAKQFDATRLCGRVNLFAAGLPCPPFSKAGKQLGAADERNLFAAGLRIVEECDPQAVMIENVRGILDPVFREYREEILGTLERLGFRAEWKLLQASDFAVPQLRPRAVLVAIKKDRWSNFTWPEPVKRKPKTVGQTLYALMAARGWEGAKRWRELASEIAPTVVGGSMKHGGPDLGPTRAKRAWAELSVNAHKLADDAPAPSFSGRPHLTVPMVALLQGFPKEWKFAGKKTNAYRQVGNAFPPPVACAVASQIRAAIRRGD